MDQDLLYKIAKVQWKKEQKVINDYLNKAYQIQLSSKIQSKLFDYQIKHTKNIIYSLQENNTTLDGSSTGTGKTYTSLAAAKYLNLKPFIICPKSILSIWKEVADYFKIEPLAIVNYDTIIRGKYYDNTGKRVKCPYIKKIGDKRNSMKFEWNLPKNCLLIFDEAHKCRNKKTYNASLLLSTSVTQTKVLMLSATISDIANKFQLFGYILNILGPTASNMRNIKRWISKSSTATYDIHKKLYPYKGARMRIKDIPDFPETQISANTYLMDNADKIQKAYDEIKKSMDELRKKIKNDTNNPLVVILRARQKIELLKISTIIELTQDFLENGMSIVIFVNFNQTLKALGEHFKTDCFIWGEQDYDTRQKNIKDFLDDKQRIIISNIQAGGVGLSLHDKNGKYPRVSIISPSWNATDLVQALGRIHRVSAKTKSLQRILFCKNTIEDDICANITKKINNLSLINDGDLNTYKISGLNDNDNDNDNDIVEI